MRNITITEFSKNTSNFLSAVEKGEFIVIMRDEKPIAEIKPISKKTGTSSFILSESSRKLAMLGGTEKQLESIPRRRY
jgi:antitoxin (DNA-binding transcriptional repressor) of toxin-antitoxin stability system